MLGPLKRTFVADYGQKNVYQIAHSMGVSSNLRRGKMLKELNRISKEHGKTVAGTKSTVIKAAWDDYRHGVVSADPAIAAARADLEKLAGPYFSGDVDSIIGSDFFRNPISMTHFNDSMRRVGLDFQIDADEALRLSKLNNTDMLSEGIKQWRNVDVEDPLDFLSRIYVAAEQVATDAAVVQNFVSIGRRKGWVSSTPKPGFARMTASGDSKYIDMLPPNVYVDKEIISEFAIMDEVARMSRSVDGELGKFIREYYDTVQGAWKYAMTITRPGHHVRNMVGDMSMTFVAEGLKFSRKSSADAFKVLKVNKTYDGLDINKAMLHMGEDVVSTGSEVISRGKFGTFTPEEITEGMIQRGQFNSVHSIEDLADVPSPLLTPERTSKFAKTVNKAFLRGGRIEKGASVVSEAREHYVRSQHFLQYIYKAQATGKDHLGRAIKSRDDLLDLASEQVKKHHPDGSMLSVKESKYMRRVIPFYAWLRGAIPAIAESAMLHPGRAVVFHKASYNLAVSMGVDPYSLSDPFPEDQMFPSFLTEQAYGPQFQLPSGEYINVNPGIAQADVGNMLGTDPLRGVAAAISPFLRAPAELLAGGSFGTGAPINDKSDYIDGTIPYINYLSNLSGMSVTGSLASLTQGKGLDPQLQVQRGNKTPMDRGLSAMNWLTGAGLNNQSKPNFINFAEIEKRNAEEAE